MMHQIVSLWGLRVRVMSQPHLGMNWETRELCLRLRPEIVVSAAATYYIHYQGATFSFRWHITVYCLLLLRVAVALLCTQAGEAGNLALPLCSALPRALRTTESTRYTRFVL